MSDKEQLLEEIMESITIDSEYNAKDIIKIIETIKIDKPQWFES